MNTGTQTTTFTIGDKVRYATPDMQKYYPEEPFIDGIITNIESRGGYAYATIATEAGETRTAFLFTLTHIN